MGLCVNRNGLYRAFLFECPDIIPLLSSSDCLQLNPHACKICKHMVSHKKRDRPPKLGGRRSLNEVCDLYLKGLNAGKGMTPPHYCMFYMFYILFFIFPCQEARCMDRIIVCGHWASHIPLTFGLVIKVRTTRVDSATYYLD